MKSAITQSPPHYAGFWVRFVASMIDTILLMAAILPIVLMVYGKEYFNSSLLIKGPIDFIVSYVFPIVAVIIFWLAKSATPGKILLGLKIVDAKTLNKPTVTQLLIRYISYYLSAIPFFLGFFWVAFDKRKQGWHDKIASTLVIHVKK